MIIASDGKISYFSKEKPPSDLLSNISSTFKLSKTELILPGFIDCHIHAAQYVNAGCCLDCELLEWLNKYTFPSESKFTSLEHAKVVYTKVVSRTLSFGTTTACYLATIHNEASLLLAKTCSELGQRAFIGKVSRDRNSPDYYIEKTEDAINNAKKFIEDMKKIAGSDLVKPVVTPIFLPSCTHELMESLGKMAKEEENGILIQTHLNENENEILWVKELEPESKSYTHAFDNVHLLTKRTILAYCVHMTEEEIDLIKERESSIAHCPDSNFCLISGCCDVRHLLDKKIKVGFGTDVSGGPSPSIFYTMRNAFSCSRALYFEKKKKDKNTDYKPLNVNDVLYLATEGGAKALGIDDKVGNFEIGKEFDGLFVNLTKGSIDCFGHETIHDLLEKFVYLGDDRNVEKVFVKGKIVKDLN